ncbi:heme-dependent catalase, partial [Rhizodiscina lignyota]
GQMETTSEGTPDNTTNSLRAGPRGYNLLEDTAGRKKIIHFGHERAPERVVHALGHGAYGTFEPYADWSNITSACWLQEGVVSDVFVRFSVVVASNGGSEVARDTHGFATKIYSKCGNQDLVGNHLPSFFINDGILFPDLIHAVKFEVDKGFPTGGSAHDTAYDFFTQRKEHTFQLMTVLSDLGIPRDVRHISGNGVHTYRFITADGKTSLFKWYWLPKLGHRSLVYDEALKIVGMNGNFQRVDLFNAINAGIFPEWDFAVQILPDDGTYMYKGIDLLDPTKIIPEEMAPMIRLGKLTLNRNPTNFFAEPESISFAPSTVVRGFDFVPDPLLQWRLMSYDDTSTHRHNSPNGYLLPVNRPIVPINNNYRDGYMQPLLFEGNSISSPNNIGGVVGSDDEVALQYTGANREVVDGPIGRYSLINDFFGQARSFWNGLDKFAQQHTVDGYRFELSHCTPPVQNEYINQVLNKVDNCLARRVAFGIGAPMPALGSGPSANNATTFPSLFPLSGRGQEQNKSNAGLAIGIIGSDTVLSQTDLNIITSALAPQQVMFEVVAPHIGQLMTGVTANQSYATTSSVFYDAVIIGSSATSGFSTTSSSNLNSSSNLITPSNFVPDFLQTEFLREAWFHGKPIAALGNAAQTFNQLGFSVSDEMGVFEGSASSVVNNILVALSGPARFPQRFPTDDLSGICQ